MTTFRSTTLAGLLLLVIVTLLSGMICASAHAQDDDAADPKDVTELDPRTQGLWRTHWRRFAKQCIEYEGEYLVCPNFSVRYTNSNNLTPHQAMLELSQKTKVKIGTTMSQTKTIRPPIEEVNVVAETIPNLRPGSYGLLSSVRVQEILGPDEMIVETIQLVDEEAVKAAYAEDRRKALTSDARGASELLAFRYEQRHRLLDLQDDREFPRTMRIRGFPTRTLTRRETWRGPKDQGISLAVVTEEVPEGRRWREGDPLQPVAVPSTLFRRAGLSEPEFAKLLASRGMDRAAFVTLVTDTMQEMRDRKLADEAIFTSLLPKVEKPDEETRRR